MHDPDYWKFSNEDGKLDRQYGGGGKHSDFVKAVDEAVAYSKELQDRYQEGYDDGVSDARRQAANGVIEESAVRMQRNPLSALTPAQLAAIRAVIMETLDDGNVEGDDSHGYEREPWDFYNPVESVANAQRLDFCDRIQQIVVARGAPATVSVTISERRCKVCGELYSPDEDSAESVCSVCATAPATVREGTR